MSTAELIDRLIRFQGPPQEFLGNLLAVQCHLASVPCGAVLRPGPGGRAEVVAAFPPLPPGSTTPVWLAQAAESAQQVLASGQTAVVPLQSPDDLYGQPTGKHLVLVPLKGEHGVRGLATFVAHGESPAILQASRDRLELSMSLLSMYEMRLTLQQRQADMRRLRLAMEINAAVNEHDRFVGGAMALCNEVASQMVCDRVSLGFHRGKYVRCRAISHTENFSRKMKIVQDIEAAMEECLDQDVEVAHPAGPEATCVSRAAAELSQRHGPTTVLSLPLRKGDDVLGVMTCERPADRPMTLAEVESLRLAIDLCAPRLASLHDSDRWFGARLAASARKVPAAVLGSTHTWIKVVVIAVFAVAVFLAFAQGDYTVDSPFVVQDVQRRIVPAPFKGFLETVSVKPDQVVVGTLAEHPSWELQPADVRNWPGLLTGLRAAGEADAPSPGKRVWSLLIESTRQAIIDGGDFIEAAPDEALTATAFDELTGLLSRKDLYQPDAWKGVELNLRAEHLVGLLAGQKPAADRIVELNRSLLASAFPRDVAPGPTVLGELDVSEILLELASASADRQGYLKRAAAAMRDGKISDAHIARAEVEKIDAKILLLRRRLGKSRIMSPIDGVVVSPDLKQAVGSPVETGKALFEIAPLTDLRAELSVPEEDIAEVEVGQTGELAVASFPGKKVAFVVERITPVAEVVDQRNVFTVRVRLLGQPEWMRPGMEGLAKIQLGRQRYIWLWTRRAVNWVRMKLWI